MPGLIVHIMLLTTVLWGKCPTDTVSFKTLTIQFAFGDEVIGYSELHFRRTGDKIIGSIGSPNTNQVLSSDVVLNSSQINTLDSFLILAEKYHKTPCKEYNISSSIQAYTIIKDMDTIRIDRFCDWQNLNFSHIQQVIFGTYLKSLEVKISSISLEFFNILKGRWKEQSPLDSLSLTSVCTLTKLRKDTITQNYIEFLSATQLIIHRKNQNIPYNYKFHFSGPYTYLELDAYQQDNNFIAGHSYLLMQSNKSKVKLRIGFP